MSGGLDIPKEMWALLADQPLSDPPPVNILHRFKVNRLTIMQGVVPDLEHPTWHGAEVVIAASVCIPMIFLVAAVRIYAKCYVTRKWTWDDSKSSLKWKGRFLFTNIFKTYS